MPGYPVHDYLDVVNGENIYKTGDWWKAVVRYYVDGNEDAEETAIYLWHNEYDGWARKNKYVIKTAEGWAQDQAIISHLLSIDGADSPMPGGEIPEGLPVSDYYTVSHAKTIFKQESWWKAITRIVAKGDYETTEVIVYLWQDDGDDWKCRQKYAVKDLDDWGEEQDLVSSFVNATDTVESGESLTTDTPESGEGDDIGKLLQGKVLKTTMADHLSREFQ